MQKVKVPQAYCDKRVQTISADVMKLPKDELRALSPKVVYINYLLCKFAFDSVLVDLFS